MTPELPTLADVTAGQAGLFTAPLPTHTPPSPPRPRRQRQQPRHRQRWTLLLEDVGGPGDPPPIARIRRLLKRTLRAYRFRSRGLLSEPAPARGKP